MIVIGFDPGPTRTGWAIIDVERASRRFLDGGHDVSTIDSFLGISSRVHADIVCIESVIGYAWEPQRSAGLIQTSEVAGVLKGLFYARGIETRSLSAKQWRSVLCGTSKADDTDVKTSLGRWITGIPTRSNAHVRDAIGVAIVGELLRGRK